MHNAFTRILPAAVASAANGNVKTLAPNSLASVYGSILATSVAVATGLPLPTTLAGAMVQITDSTGASQNAPLIYAGKKQVNLLVPGNVASGAAQLTISSPTGTISQASTQIAPVAPGLFTMNANGLAAANVLDVSASGTQSPENDYALQGGQIVANPISLGAAGDRVYLILFGTGLRAAGTSGVQVTIGGQQASIAYAEPQGAFLCLDQVYIVIPRCLAGQGDFVVQLSANGISANPVHITIR